MITPSKTISLSESALGQSTAILGRGPDARDLVALYQEVADKFPTVDDFILALDLLYVLGRIDVDQPTRLLTYAD